MSSRSPEIGGLSSILNAVGFSRISKKNKFFALAAGLAISGGVGVGGAWNHADIFSGVEPAYIYAPSAVALILAAMAVVRGASTDWKP